MAISAVWLSGSTPLLLANSNGATNKMVLAKETRARRPAIGNVRHFTEVMRKDAEFLKKRISRGLQWANATFRIPQVSKTLEDLVWLRNLEDPSSPPVEPRSWPQPSYPELSGVDLFMADLKALEAYASYFYYLSRAWSRPLPDVYDPQAVADYFSCRPHVVAFRLLEVFSAFMLAAIRIRISGTQNSSSGHLDKQSNTAISEQKFGLVLKDTMLNLGPTFIKVGQSLSTRPDIIGSEISKALSELHEQIPPFPRHEAVKIIEEELGAPVQSHFSYISQETVAAASFGQVYRGRTHDGSDVAVKVQRPDLLHVVVRDIYILRLALGVLQKVAKRRSDLRLYADELGKGLVGELDYRVEAVNASRYLEAHSRFPFIRVPKVYQHLSRKRVLTMEWIVGESPTDLLAIDGHSENSDRHRIDAKLRLLDLVKKGVEATLVQLLETGILHADPHPGNLRYTSSGQIGFLDFGLICEMERKHQFAMLASIVHIVNGDWASLVQALTEMDVVRPGTNIRHVTMELEDAIGEVEIKDGIPDIKFSRVLSKIVSVAVKYHFRMPPYFTLLLRSLASFEGMAVAADKNFKTFQAAYPFVVQKLLTENSAATRKILYSVVLNRRKEFRWERLALFLRIGATRKGLLRVLMLSDGTSIDYLPGAKQGIDIANLILKLLPSKDGVVLRRLLMTADGASLIRALVSKDAQFVRVQISRVIADVLYQWMFKITGLGAETTQYSSQVILAGNRERMQLDPLVKQSRPVVNDYQVFFGDRRLKVIFSKVMSSMRKDPILTARFCWASLVIFLRASALACYRVVISLSEASLERLPFTPKRLVAGA